MGSDPGRGALDGVDVGLHRVDVLLDPAGGFLAFPVRQDFVGVVVGKDPFLGRVSLSPYQTIRLYVFCGGGTKCDD